MKYCYTVYVPYHMIESFKKALRAKLFDVHVEHSEWVPGRNRNRRKFVVNDAAVFVIVCSTKTWRYLYDRFHMRKATGRSWYCVDHAAEAAELTLIVSNEPERYLPPSQNIKLKGEPWDYC